MRDTWSLDAIYTGYDDPNFELDLKKLEELIASYNHLASNLSGDHKKDLLDILSMEEELHELAGKVIEFASLQQSVNTSDMKSASTMGNCFQMLSETTKAETQFHKYIASMDDLSELIESDAKLKEYEFMLNSIKQDDKYQLMDAVEEALAKMDISGGNAWSDLQSSLTSKLKVAYNGETTTLSAIRNLAYDSDPAVRKAAYEAELASYPQIEDAVSFALNSIKMQATSECQLRGFDSVLDKTLYQSRMKKETLDAMFSAIDDYLPVFHSYLAAKGKALGHENGLPWYDMFAPMGSNDKEYTIEEAKDYLLNLFGGFNPELQKIAGRAFNESWIDFYPRPGKVGGAFCADVSCCKQFRILTNFAGSFSDVVTLAHELGHGYHDFMVHDNLPLNRSYTMPVAETASTFNENVVMNAAIAAAKTNDEKLALIESQLSDTTQIICDIYSRFLFEKEVCERRKSEFLSAEELCSMMLSAQKKAYGTGLDNTVLHPYMWVCKGHYYSAGLGFYNFPYAFGGLFANGLYQQYLNEGESFIPKFNRMLNATATTTVEGAAALCGIDLTKKDFWSMSLASIAKKVELFKELVK